MSLYKVINLSSCILTYKDNDFFFFSCAYVNKKTKKSVIDCLDNAF